MGRPRRENADYFSHDTNMRSHRKIIALRSKFGITGYAVYNMLLEHIGSCNFFQCNRNDIEQEILAGDFGIEFALLGDIVGFCHRLGLIQIDGEIIKCQSLTDRLKDLIDKRNRERDRVPVTETPQKSAEMPQSKVKESIVNKNIYKTISRGRGKSNLEITIEDNQKLLDQGRTQEILDSQYDAIENYSKNGKYTSLYLTTLQRLKKVEKPKPKNTITEDDDIYSLMA